MGFKKASAFAAASLLLRRSFCSRFSCTPPTTINPNHQPVDGVEWPRGLEQLLFGRVFNQQIQGAVWASGLRLLALGDFFDQALTGVAWPQNLEFLSLGNKFNQVGVGVGVERLISRVLPKKHEKIV